MLGSAPRLATVLKLVTQKANWGSPLPANTGRGLACVSAQEKKTPTWTASVVQANVDPATGVVKIEKIVCAVDCGIVVNPDGARAQIEGSILFGISNALKERGTIANGALVQSNFHDYQVLRMNEVPDIEVYLVPSTEYPTGLGEPGTTTIAPALSNAIFAATGPGCATSRSCPTRSSPPSGPRPDLRSAGGAMPPAQPSPGRATMVGCGLCRQATSCSSGSWGQASRSAGACSRPAGPLLRRDRRRHRGPRRPEYPRDLPAGRRADLRRLEVEALEALRLKADDVIATGGGLPCHEGRMDVLRELGTVVRLRGELDEVLARARRSGNRPMLDGRSPEEIAALYRGREAFYAQAHVTVDTAGLGIDQVVGRILAALRERHAARV